MKFDDIIKDLEDETSGGGTKGVYEDIVFGDQILMKGHRDTLSRYKLFDSLDLIINEAKVLDLGCNLGMVAQYFVNKGAYTWGIDKNEKFVKWAQYFVPTAKFKKFDVDKLEKKFIHNVLGADSFDIVCCLAIWDYLNEEHTSNLLRSICSDILIFEGHSDGVYRLDNSIKYQGKILKSWKDILENVIKVKSYELIGWVDNDTRPVFICKMR